MPIDDELSVIIDFHRACPEWDHKWLLLRRSHKRPARRPFTAQAVNGRRAAEAANGIHVATHLLLHRGEPDGSRNPKPYSTE